VRDSVLWFAGKMEQKLQANDHKVGWSGLPDPYFVQRAQGELQELADALASGMPVEDIILECADVANFVMMLADKKRQHEQITTRGKHLISKED
jgi:hypothetical protein